jgi:hypothetical protein
MDQQEHEAALALLKVKLAQAKSEEAAIRKIAELYSAAEHADAQRARRTSTRANQRN